MQDHIVNSAPVELDPLSRIGLATATDKAWLHSYTPHYHRHFARFRDREISLLELGIGGDDNEAIGGHSLAMWAEYFPRARILGIDIYDKSALAKGNIRIEQGSQSDPEFARDIIERYGPFDIIIDDGSHRTDDVTASLKLYWPALKLGGIYAIEDMAYAYVDGYRCGRDADDPKLSANVMTARMTRLFNRPPAASDDEWAMLEDTVAELHVVENLVFIEKEDAPSKQAIHGGTKARWAAALAEVDAAIADGGPDAFALTKGRILHVMGRSDEVADWIKRACNYRNDAESWHFLGNLLIQRDDVEGALAAQLKSIACHDRNPHVHAAAGVAYAKLGRAPEAEAAFAKALAIRPQSDRIIATRERALRVAARVARGR